MQKSSIAEDYGIDITKLEGVDNEWVGFLSFEVTPIYKKLMNLPQRTIGIFSGNQGGKTAGVAKHYTDRLLGAHPVEYKNRLMRKVRCMSSTLPEDSSAEEQDNTQYLELKKRIPYHLIEKDITARQKNLVVRRPADIGGKTIFEFRSSRQELQDLGKIQLSSVWHDEETPKPHREECKMRLLAENGDEIFTLTPTNALTYTFDEVWQNASYIWRTDTICSKLGLPKEERKNTGHDIACIQMATDDNPTLDEDVIERLFEDVDPHEYTLRRYGVFKATSGRIHKTYDPSYCYIDYNATFPDGVPYGWFHWRAIDFHESRTPWSVGWLSASPQNEWFMWQEFHPAIDGPQAYNTYDIARTIARRSGDYYYPVNLIDPLANKKQPNTGFSVTEDLNRFFDEMQRNEGLGAAAQWQGWDTKGTVGRGNVSRRFKNAVRCGKPFNNAVREHGRTKYLPTLWICDTCPETHKSVMNWRYGEYVTAATKMVNDPKSEPQQRFSHDNMVLECSAKDSRIQNAFFLISNPPKQVVRKHISITGA